MLTLAIETATNNCSVALLDEEQVVSELLLTRPRSHAEFLVPMIEQALQMAAKQADDVGLVAVSMGPGSYTGLRIGVSTAKGFAYATNAALVGVPSLDAVAHAVAEHAEATDAIVVAFGARRNEVYAAVYDAAPRAVIAPPAAVPLSELGEWVSTGDRRLWVAGDATERVLKELQPVFTARAAPIQPNAAAVGRVGLQLFHDHGAADLTAFEPFYLKEFVAKKQKKTIFERLPF